MYWRLKCFLDDGTRVQNMWIMKMLASYTIWSKYKLNQDTDIRAFTLKYF